MAAIDYGVLVFKNGEQLYAEKLFPTVYVGSNLYLEIFKDHCLVMQGDPACRGGHWPPVNCDNTPGHPKEVLLEMHGCHIYEPGGLWKTTKKSTRVGFLRMDGIETRFHFKEIFRGEVYRLTINLLGDHWTILYGLGIDNKPLTWRRVKTKYLGKTGAKTVDREIEKAAPYSAYAAIQRL